MHGTSGRGELAHAHDVLADDIDLQLVARNVRLHQHWLRRQGNTGQLAGIGVEEVRAAAS